MNAIEELAYEMEQYIHRGREYTSIAITKDSDLNSVLDTIFREVYCKSYHTNEYNKQHQDVWVKFYLFSEWSLYKTIYKFPDEYFWNELNHTEDTEFHIGAFYHLPVTSFMIVPPNNFNGCYILRIELLHGKAVLYLLKLRIEGKDDVVYSCDYLEIAEGERISQAVRETLIKDQDSVEEFYERSFERMKMAIQVAYYLSAQNAVIKEIKTPKSARPKRPDGKPMNLRQWQVGYRIGSSFPNKNSNATGTGAPDIHRASANSPRPHIRRAHWHHYWAGQGRKELILKWLDPIMVNGGENIIATEHHVA